MTSERQSEMVWCPRTPITFSFGSTHSRSLLSHWSSVQMILIIARWSPVVGRDCERSVSPPPACRRASVFSLWENRGKEWLKLLDQSHSSTPNPVSQGAGPMYWGQGRQELCESACGKYTHIAALYKGSYCSPSFPAVKHLAGCGEGCQLGKWRGVTTVPLLPKPQQAEEWGQCQRLGAGKELGVSCSCIAGVTLLPIYFVRMRLH